MNNNNEFYNKNRKIIIIILVTILKKNKDLWTEKRRDKNKTIKLFPFNYENTLFLFSFSILIYVKIVYKIALTKWN